MLGSKAIFAGGVNNGSGTTVVDVYDTDNDEWSIQTLSQPREFLGGTAVGIQALFAGDDAYGFGTGAVDIYTDTSPVANLAGGVSRDSKGASVTIINDG